MFATTAKLGESCYETKLSSQSQHAGTGHTSLRNFDTHWPVFIEHYLSGQFKQSLASSHRALEQSSFST